MPIDRKIKESESYNIRKLDDGKWVLGIHTKEDFLEFSYENTDDLLASLKDELGKSKGENKEKKEKSGFKKMMDDEENDDE